MRVAVVFFPSSKPEKMASVSRALAEGIERQGHQVDLIDGTREVGRKVAVYQYIAMGVEQTNLFGGKIPDKVRDFLSETGMVAGKKSSAYILKHPLGEGRTLKKLMAVMEKEALFLRVFHSLRSEEQARTVGAGLKIE